MSPFEYLIVPESMVTRSQKQADLDEAGFKIKQGWWYIGL